LIQFNLFIRKVVEGACQNRLEAVFESFDMNPIASASIGQVHVAALKGDYLDHLTNPSTPLASIGSPNLSVKQRNQSSESLTTDQGKH
jgi:hypothetical protein